MEIFWRLIFGHFLSDFTLQTNTINVWKRSSVWGMVAHAAVHLLTNIVLTWPYLEQTWVNTRFLQLSGWTCILILFIIHFIEDEWRVYTIFRFNTPDSALYFLWDQIIHCAAIFLFFPLGLLDAETSLMPEKWPALGVLFVMATHFTTVFVYFMEKDFWGLEFPNDSEKYLGIAERLLVALSFLLPGHWWALFTGAWVVYRILLRSRRIQDFTWLNFSVSGLMAAACGVLGRLIYFS